MDQAKAIYAKQIAPAMEQADKMLLAKIPHFSVVQEKGVRPVFVALGAGLTILFIISFMIGGAGLCNLVGFVYPVIGSYKALKTQGKDDDTQWLTYWVVYSFFNMFESITDLLDNMIPMYYLLKCVLLVYLFSPMTKGANLVYKAAIEPALDKYIPSVEAAADKGKNVIRSVASDAAKSE